MIAFRVTYFGSMSMKKRKEEITMKIRLSLGKGEEGGERWEGKEEGGMSPLRGRRN